MRRIILNVVVVCGIFLMFPSCEYLSNLNRTGDIVVEEQEIVSFDKLTVNAPYEIVFVQDENPRLVFEGYDYLMEQVEVSQNNGELVLDNADGKYIQKSKMLKVTIYSPHIKYVTMNRPGELYSFDTLKENAFTLIVNGPAAYTESDLKLDCNQFNIRVYGEDQMGTHVISGHCETMNVTVEGTANVNAFGLLSKGAKVIHRSVGKCKVDCTESLDVQIYSSGNTYYLGDPSTTIERIYTETLKPTGNVYKD